MNKNVINCKKSEFVPGRTLRATVKVVHKMGVEVKMPSGRGSGIISSRCWGTGIERDKALAAIRPGDEFDVVVRSYDARTMTLSLALVGCEYLGLLPGKGQKKMVRQESRPQSVAYPRKPSFVPIAVDTMLLWDASNLLGVVGAENAARTFGAIAGSMSEQGYKTMFFIERRCLTWALHNQRSTDEADALDAFARRGDVVVVGDGGNGTGEADCAILQMAEALPGSVCVTRDRYEDYACTYPGIVGTDRIRSFSVAKADGKSMILVNGLAHAIVVEDGRKKTAIAPSVPAVGVQTPKSMVSLVVAPVVTSPAERQTPSTEVDNASGHSGLFAVADERVRCGDTQGAVRLYAKVAKRNPVAYRVLAAMYREGHSVDVDKKKALHYEHLARTSEKRCRERSLRERRMRAEAIRGGRYSVDHFAAKRRKALGLAIFAENHEIFCERRRLKGARRVMNRVSVRAA